MVMVMLHRMRLMKLTEADVWVGQKILGVVWMFVKGRVLGMVVIRGVVELRRGMQGLEWGQVGERGEGLEGGRNSCNF